MDLMSSSFLPGDPRMVDQIVYELKSQGIFDQFRKECIADVDTKPAYQNLRQRVEGSVMNFLKKRKFASDTNKNQLREQLRKNITESGFLESGVERIVDQVVNPKISSVFLPKVEEVVYRFLGIQKPESASTSQDDKVKTGDLLPTDLEAVSPESVHETSNVSATELSSENVESTNNEANNTSLTKTDDESPPFEPLEENTKLSMQEDNSVDSRYSGASGNDSVLGTSNQSMDVSENSQINGNLNSANLSEDVKMDICDNTMASENSDKLEIVEEPKSSEQKTEEKHKRSHDKYKSSKSDKHREDSKDKRERSKSESKSKDSKEKSSSKHTSSSSKDKDKKEESSEKEFNLEKYKIPKKEDNDKNKDSKKKSEKSGERDKSSRERTKSERDRHDKERSSSHKSKERSSSSSKKDDKDKKHREERDDKSSKDKNSSSSKSSSSRNKESSSKDRSSKDKPKSSSSSKDKEKTSESKRTHEDSKSSKRDKHKGHESSSKKEKEKSVSDDHYSFKNKKRERRSTDRDSNDGSGKTNRHESLVDSTSENSSKSSKKDTSENFSSGGDTSSNSDKVDKCNEAEEVATSTDVVNIQPIKYMKPKFASNMQEAIKIMKIRKQLAKLERENQLTLSQIPMITTEPAAEFELEPEMPASEVEAQPPEENTPVLKSQDLSLESFEALEARLAQEMSNIGEHMYGDEDDENDESSVVSVSSIKKRKVDTQAEFEEDATDTNVVKKVKINGSFEHTENVSTLNSSDKENHIIENSVSQRPKRRVSEEFIGFTAAERKRSEKIMEKVVKGKTAIPSQDSSTKLVTTPKTIDNRLFIKLNKMNLKSSSEVESMQNGDISAIEEDEEPCYFFRKESLLVSERRLAILNQYVVRLEQHVEETQNNVPYIIKRGLKRKLEGTENNNSLNCNYKPATKRNHLSNANSNETVCNTNVSSHPDFSLPLSPAESEKSGENKKEEPVMVKPKRGSATKRYSSADLYKPRPVLSGSSTRRRSARTCLDAPKP